MKVVVETNVTIAANGRDTHASLGCQYDCVEFLEKLASVKSRDQILLDAGGLILDEYRPYLNYKGQPGTGDLFYKFLHDHMYLDKRVKQVSISPVADETRGFEELPANSLDKSDRKFLAVAVVAKGAVVNALDSDWHEQATFIKALGVPVKQLCPAHACPEPAA
ncbi:MAG: hypothetical protein Q8M09_07850 [Pseudomonadota bacterium]|nr:hypothetical protein [Pseudomonadota bacterium]MDP1904140.1 hypothetical protein [Pseudomonadota bacterium]MDP2353767.1 hypothetical protein [Pseudomonadota bacterium]